MRDYNAKPRSPALCIASRYGMSLSRMSKTEKDKERKIKWMSECEGVGAERKSRRFVIEFVRRANERATISPFNIASFGSRSFDLRQYLTACPILQNNRSISLLYHHFSLWLSSISSLSPSTWWFVTHRRPGLSPPLLILFKYSI